MSIPPTQTTEQTHPTRIGSFMDKMPFSVPIARLRVGATLDPDMHLSEKDDLFKHQLGQGHPPYLSEQSFFAANVVQNEAVTTILSKATSTSAKVYHTLLNMGIISRAPGPGSTGQVKLPVDTTKIDKSFTNKLYFVSIGTQRRIVGMLFFWEEECTRWRLLDDEESEILQAIEKAPADMRAELEFRLKSVEMQRHLCPSEREVEQQERLPSYGNAESGLSHQVEPRDGPPAYQG